MHAYFTDVSCGGAHTAAVVKDGSVYLWGLNDRGQLAQGDEAPFLQVLVSIPHVLKLCNMTRMQGAGQRVVLVAAQHHPESCSMVHHRMPRD